MKITATQLDLLVQSQERPEPVPLRRDLLGSPICPMIEKADWSQSISLTSRWLTDVTKPIGGKRQAMILSSRPVRSQTVQVVADSKESATELLMSLLDFSTYNGNPVPIFCDGAEVKSREGNAAFGDFSLRRFFPGGRIVFIGHSYYAYALVQEVGPTELRFDLDPSEFAMPPEGCYVFPCMDAEMVTDSSVTMKTDSVHVASITWNELEGISCLPAIWPAISPEDGSNALPIAQVIDNKPVFNLEPDWSDSPEVRIDRDVTTDSGSRGAVIETKGDVFLTFSFSLMGYDRKRSWQILRWFDLMRGRAGLFWLVHPSRPWPQVSVLTTSGFSLPAVSTSSAFSRNVKRVAFIRSNGQVVIRSISLVSGFDFTLDSPLPDTNFVDVQPVYVVSFNEDSIVENWATDSVIPSISLSMSEQKEYGVVSIGPSMGYQEGYPGLYGIPGLSFFVKAGVECYSSDGRPCYVWPSNNSMIYEWRDIREGPKRDYTPAGLRRKLVSLNASDGGLARFPDSNINNGQPAVFSPNFDMTHLFDASLEDGDKHIWGSSGFTLFLAFTPQAMDATAVDKLLFSIEAGAVGIRFYYDRAGQAGNNRHALQVKSTGTWQTAALSESLSDKETACCLAIHVDNAGSKARVWLNGAKALSSALSASLPIPTATYTSAWFFPCFASGLSTGSALLAQAFGLRGTISSLICFSRPLDEAELNTVLKMVSDSYKTPAGTISLYA